MISSQLEDASDQQTDLSHFLMQKNVNFLVLLQSLVPIHRTGVRLQSIISDGDAP